MARLPLKDWLLPLFLLCGCVTPGAEGGGSPPPRPTVGARTSEGVAQALDRAQAAFLAGNWGEAVVQANRVLEGAAGTDEYYAAVKILGLASCARKDPRPVGFAWKRLLPADRDSLRNQCEASGLSIDDGGNVTSAQP